MLTIDGSNALEKFEKLLLLPVDAKISNLACRTSDQSNPVYYQVGQNEKKVMRPHVPDDKVDWCIKWKEYDDHICINYTSPIVFANPDWADPHPPSKQTKWNDIDNKIDRRSHIKPYSLSSQNYPLNPMGRTGIRERGLLGKWGPNHAADPIVTRWKRDAFNNIMADSRSQKPILQFVAIRRVDTKEWAIPGGMCDAGEKVSNTMTREFMEEALNSEEMTENEKKSFEKLLSDFFQKGVEIYKGYVDDPRNTDNAWMETIAYNFHDEDNAVFKNITLTAGDDASHVKWTDISVNLKLYASHKAFIEKVAKMHNAFWSN